MSARLHRIARPLSLALVLTSACGGSPQSDAPAGPTLPATTSSTTASSDSPLVDLVRSDALRPYWHASLPGRVPVRIVANPNSTDRPAFTLLGAPVVWITPEQAEPGSAFLVVDFQLVDGLLNLSVRYPVEGIRASAVYVPSGDGWERTGPVRVVEE
ncbi:MAG: hypothetical protein KC593_23620 [Myxococcales bacterium]|nr:hypothetical protein [Myxococcales bacterium]MCB9630101.1 hypothetical protein [Sandaracinaceae bacterium]